MHQVETLVDVFKRHHMRNEIVDIDLAVHIPVDNARHIGAPARAAKGRALPHATRHQLERSRRDFLTRARHADDSRNAPAAMAAFQRLPHGVHIADALEAVVRAAARQLHEMRNDIAVDLLRIDEMRHAESPRHGLAFRIDVDADDHIGAHHLRALNDIEPNAAKPEDDDIGARFHLGRIDHRADARRHAAADVADLVERRVLADLRQRDFRQHRVIRESRTAHVMHDGLALVAKAARPVRHQPLALRRADRRAEIGLVARAALALAALRRIERDHMVAHFKRLHTLADFHDNARAFMAEDRREDTFRVRTRQRESVRMADARRLDLHQHLALLGPIKLHSFDFQRLSFFKSHSGTHIHHHSP